MLFIIQDNKHEGGKKSHTPQYHQLSYPRFYSSDANTHTEPIKDNPTSNWNHHGMLVLIFYLMLLQKYSLYTNCSGPVGDSLLVHHKALQDHGYCKTRDYKKTNKSNRMVSFTN